MKQFTKATKAILFAVFMMVAASCTKQDDNNSFPSGGGSNGGETPEPTSIPQLIREHVVVNASYNDYLITTTMTTTLEEVLSGQSIKYGVEYGYLRENEADDVLDNKLYLTRQGNAYSNEFLLFYNADSEWPCGAYGVFHYDTYMYFQRQMQNGHTLTDDERELYDETLMYLADYEQKAARAFTGRFFIEVDGVKYDYKYMYFDFWPNLHLDIDN